MSGIQGGKFGGDRASTGTNSRPDVTNVSTLVLASNPNRIYASFFNQSGSVMYFKYGSAAVTNQGIRVPNNSLLEITGDNLWTGDVFAIVGAGNQPLDVFEATA